MYNQLKETLQETVRPVNKKCSDLCVELGKYLNEYYDTFKKVLAKAQLEEEVVWNFAEGQKINGRLRIEACENSVFYPTSAVNPYRLAFNSTAKDKIGLPLIQKTFDYDEETGLNYMDYITEYILPEFSPCTEKKV